MKCQKHDTPMVPVRVPSVNGIVPMIAKFRCVLCAEERLREECAANGHRHPEAVLGGGITRCACGVSQSVVMVL